MANPPPSNQPTSRIQEALQVKLTPEEEATLRQCGREALLYRALPLGAVCFAVGKYAIMRGALSPALGWLKTFAFGFIGYAVGKMSYMPVCKERILALENSPMAARLRESMKHGTSRGATVDEAYVFPSVEEKQSVSTPEYQPNSVFQSSANSDDDRKHQSSTTHDDLRVKHRTEAERNYGAKMTQRYSRQSKIPEFDEKRGANETESLPRPVKKKTNIYGDEIED